MHGFSSAHPLVAWLTSLIWNKNFSLPLHSYFCSFRHFYIFHFHLGCVLQLNSHTTLHQLGFICDVYSTCYFSEFEMHKCSARRYIVGNNALHSLDWFLGLQWELFSRDRGAACQQVNQQSKWTHDLTIVMCAHERAPLDSPSLLEKCSLPVKCLRDKLSDDERWSFDYRVDLQRSSCELKRLTVTLAEREETKEWNEIKGNQRRRKYSLSRLMRDTFSCRHFNNKPPAVW